MQCRDGLKSSKPNTHHMQSGRIACQNEMSDRIGEQLHPLKRASRAALMTQGTYSWPPLIQSGQIWGSACFFYTPLVLQLGQSFNLALAWGHVRGHGINDEYDVKKIFRLYKSSGALSARSRTQLYLWYGS